MGDREHSFWVVWCPQGGSPTVRHHAEYLARQEASRLASKNPGHEFVVLKAVSGFQIQHICETRYS